MKVVIVYDRVNKWGGAERVLLSLHELFPDAPLYTSVYSPDDAPWASVFPKVVPSFINRIPFFRKRHELLAIIMPIIFESFNFDDYDLVISVTSEAAKGIITKPKTRHICYLLTPTRYLWSGYKEYFKSTSFIDDIFKLLVKPFLYYLRHWDKMASQRPDKIISISTEIQMRARKYYSRDSEIIFPPVENKTFEIRETELRGKDGEYYLLVSRLVNYKRVDLAIQVFNKLGRKLVIVGKGSQKNKLKRIAKNNIKFIEDLTDKELADYYRCAKALIFPGFEDFGIVMAESLLCETPVIAYAKGGARDIIEDGKTGILFDRQDIDSLANAIYKLDKLKFKRKYLRSVGERFSSSIFKKNFFSEI
jgi:glycosyltransferase involved in cell wall biosynthesis